MQDTTMKGDESFEFFSEEWLKNNKDSNFFPNEDILFCGNFIFSKQPISKDTQEFKKHGYENTKVDMNSGSSRDRQYAKLMSMNKGRNYGGEHETKRVFPASASMKSRWYYYGFRLAGVPAEMDLGAMRSRQSRRRKTHSVGAQGGGEKMDNGGLKHGKGLSRLIRDLSCDGQTQANSMVKASLVCIPRV